MKLDSVECCFQPADFSTLEGNSAQRACVNTCREERCKLTRIMPQHTPRTTRRRSSEQKRTVCTDKNQMVWRPILGILARVGQNAFRGGIVNHWYHSEMSTSGGVRSLEASAAALYSTRSAGCRVEAELGAPARCPSSFVGKRSNVWKSSNTCCAMGLGTLTRGRSCATSSRSQRTWQCGNESVCDTWEVLSFRDSRFSSVWSVVAT